MKQLLLSILVIFFLGGYSFAQDASEYEPLVYHSSKGDSLLYRFHIPDGAQNASKRYPLVIFLHGSGERGNDNSTQLVHVAKRFVTDEFMARYPAFVIVPQCPADQQWANYSRESEAKHADKEPTRQLELVMELMDEVLKKYPVERRRVYIGGLSMGGYGVWSALANYPEKFAAAFPICGGGYPSFAPRMAQVPTWVFHGGADTVVPPDRSREMVESIRRAGGQVIYTEFPGVGHNSWDPAFPAFEEYPFIYDWIFTQRKWK
ncbi:MAG: prolyl oligopeptidase family serine peptidase [Bacteroidia bacterium]|nr:prolyl oligopeptidase family serine peptidase [Bacteroidia bacterium]